MSPAELISMLYHASSDPTSFGKRFATDPSNNITSSRLQKSLSQEMIRLLISCVREDALMRRDDVNAAIQETIRTIESTILEVKVIEDK